MERPGTACQAILVQSSSSSIQIGGTGVGQFNQIIGNGAGIHLITPSTGQIRRNFIRGNTGGGIVFGFDSGHTPNDVPDADGIQNDPVVSSAVSSGGQIAIHGLLDSNSTNSYSIDLFASSSCDPSGYGEGATFLGDVAVPAGTVHGSFTMSVPSGATGVVTATATGSGGTSEFSACRAIATNPPETFTVTSTGDSATDTATCTTACTLREAVNSAEAHPGPDAIQFAIPGSGLQTIALAASLPDISDSVTIDGTTQPGWSAGHPVIQISDGGTGAWAIRVTGGSATIRGLIINGYSIQITLTGGSGHVIAGNYLATDSAGTSANGGQGVNTDGATDGTIGGTSSADRNVIGGTGMGVEIAGGSGNLVEGNYIGVAPDGQTRISGAVNGVGLDANGNTVGGTTTGAGNVIAVETNGITFSTNASNNLVEGNSIGVTADEAQVLPEDVGIDVESGTGNQIGASNAGNVIAGSADVGIEVKDGPNTYTGNFVGTSRAGVAYATRNDTGVRVLGGSGSVFTGNTVAGSAGLGFEVAATGITISQNSLFANVSGGIALDGNVPQDTAIVSSINSPVDDGNTISGTFDMHDGGAVGQYHVEFFASPTPCTPGEAKTYLGAIDTSLSGDGFQGRLFSVPAKVGAGLAITAIATHDSGTTSAISDCVVASASSQGDGTLVVNTAADTDDGGCFAVVCSLRDAINAANQFDGLNEIDFAIGTGVQTIHAQLAAAGHQHAGRHRGRHAAGRAKRKHGHRPQGAGRRAGLVLELGSSQSTIRGLDIQGFTDPANAGILVESNDNLIEDNYIGTTADGTAAAANVPSGRRLGGRLGQPDR